MCRLAQHVHGIIYESMTDSLLFQVQGGRDKKSVACNQMLLDLKASIAPLLPYTVCSFAKLWRDTSNQIHNWHYTDYQTQEVSGEEVVHIQLHNKLDILAKRIEKTKYRDSQREIIDRLAVGLAAMQPEQQQLNSPAQQQGLQHLKTALDLLCSQYGYDHDNVLYFSTNLYGLALLACQQYQEAEEELKESLQTCQNKFGTNSHAAVQCLRNLAQVYCCCGKALDAELQMRAAAAAVELSVNEQDAPSEKGIAMLRVGVQFELTNILLCQGR